MNTLTNFNQPTASQSPAPAAPPSAAPVGADLSSPNCDWQFPFPDHPLAELFPLMEPVDLAALADNIRRHGLRTPIVLYEGCILDGRNRARACRLAGVELRTEDFPTDGNPLDFVVSANLHRRHLTTGQRALLAAKIATLPRGRNWTNSSNKTSVEEAAGKLRLGTSIVKEARTVLQDAAQTRAVQSGEKSVHAAAEEIRAAKAVTKAPRDHADFEIPEPLWSLWNRRKEIETIQMHVSKARDLLDSASQIGDVLFAPTDLGTVLSNLDVVIAELALSVPYAVCDTCDGVNFEVCPTCQGRGFLNQQDFQRDDAPSAVATP